VLFSNAGYTYLDVRPSLELSEAGKVKACVNIPIVNSKWVYNKELRKKEMVKEPNASFVADVQKRFPNTEAPLLIACSDGRTYSIDALEALDEAGYTNLVGLRGGYYNWYATWDANLRRRRNGEYAEQYTHDGDSCGIHSSGAGFERVDSVEKWAPPKF
jgi:rhodanese-related sulfurtransferase